MTVTFTPPYSVLNGARTQLQERGYVLLEANDVASLAGCDLSQLQALESSWNQLAVDQYLKDGGRYRKRRHSCFEQSTAVSTLTQTARRAHWQPLQYNALHGGMQRWFEPIEPSVCADQAWRGLLMGIGALGTVLCQTDASWDARWAIEAHQFRIDTADGIGRPTPEGAHRDGVQLVAVLLINRHHIKGGETRIFEANGPSGQRFTLAQPWSLLLLDDERMIHETTPIQPIEPDALGHRDTLVLTYRMHGFMGP